MPLRRLHPNARTVVVAKLLRAWGRKRTPGRLPRQQQPDTIRREYYRALRELVLVPMWRAAERVKTQAVRGLELLRRAQSKTDALDNDARDAVRRAGKLFTESLKPSALEAVAEKFGKRTSAFQKEQLNRQTLAAIGVPFEAIEKPTRDILPDFTKENVALVKTIPERYFDRIEREVQDAYASGMTPSTLAERLMEIDETSESDAMRIARDQIGKLNAQFNEERQTGMGVTGYTWNGAMDNRERDEHRAREGQHFEWDSPPEDGHPGEPIQCFPGETCVLLHTDVSKAYRRSYSGQLTTLVTTSGESIRCTPNHPVLTRRGWIAAHLVDVGDYVFQACPEFLDGSIQDPQRGDAPIAQVFGALAALRVPHRVALFTGGFHGDASIDEQVDVVDIDGLLSLELDPRISQGFCQQALARADRSTLHFSQAYFALVRNFGAAYASIRGASKLLTLLGSHSTMASKHRSGPTAYLYTLALELGADSSSRDAEALRQSLDAAAASVEPRYALARVVFSVVRRSVDTPTRRDPPSAEKLRQIVAGVQSQLAGDFGESHFLQHPSRVVDKFNREARVHVFNLETSSGWYVAQNLIVSNCRCVATPDFTQLLAARSED